MSSGPSTGPFLSLRTVYQRACAFTSPVTCSSHLRRPSSGSRPVAARTAIAPSATALPAKEGSHVTRHLGRLLLVREQPGAANGFEHHAPAELLRHRTPQRLRECRVVLSPHE